MSRSLLPAPFVALALALALSSCGGGGSTTATGTTVMRHAKRESTPTYLPDVAGGRRTVEPTTYSLSVDGDAIAKSIDWHGWGEATATGFGTIAERPASGLVDTFSGSLTASKPRACEGARYYTEVFAHVPPQADFVPTAPTKLSTPCS